MKNETFKIKIKTLQLIFLFCIFSVKPEPPVISLNQTGIPLREGDSLMMTCSTTAGNPPPGIRWLRNNDVITDGSVMTLPDEIFGVTSSVLVRRLERADHHGNYTCTAENEANYGHPVMNSVTLNVQCEYKPRYVFIRCVFKCYVIKGCVFKRSVLYVPTTIYVTPFVVHSDGVRIFSVCVCGGVGW